MRHKGVRPLHPLSLIDWKKKSLYYEEYPNGTFRIWTIRQLVSGCDGVVREMKELQGCYYCPHCDEWFSKDQWSET